MTRTLAFAVIVLEAAVLVFVGGCKSKESAVREEATRRQDEAAKSLGIPKIINLDLGDTITMELALIPAGTFMMGSPATEKDRGGNEGPQHAVTISKPFYMGVYEVTQEQYAQIMYTAPKIQNKDGTKYEESKIASLDRGKEGQIEGKTPVEHVAGDDMVEFCKRVSRKTGKTVQLPTEAQWEYACRACTTTPFNTGEEITAGQANFSRKGFRPERGRDYPKAVAVGSFKPNAWGLYDMHGNVDELCADRLRAYSDAAVNDPVGPPTGNLCVLRGGSYGWFAEGCRSASRYGVVSPGSGGFRVVVVGVN